MESDSYSGVGAAGIKNCLGKSASPLPETDGSNGSLLEKKTGIMLGRNGGSHVQKGVDMANYIENKILTQDLSSSDRALAESLLEDLNNALGR